ncbi:hypothetical protein BJ912DRAFT_1144192 [Pholiota molesta]|nr:hypothetical protein BJ912DRAFT_1144192 [Pholiota molesta]
MAGAYISFSFSFCHSASLPSPASTARSPAPLTLKISLHLRSTTATVNMLITNGGSFSVDPTGADYNGVRRFDPDSATPCSSAPRGNASTRATDDEDNARLDSSWPSAMRAAATQQQGPERGSFVVARTGAYYNGVAVDPASHATSWSSASRASAPTGRAPHIRANAGGSTRATVVEIADDEEDARRESSWARAQRRMRAADGSDGPVAADSNQKEKSKPHGRKEGKTNSKAPARSEQQPRVVDVSDEEDDAWINIQDGAGGEGYDVQDGAGSQASSAHRTTSARTHRTANASPVRPQLFRTSTAHFDGPAVPVRDDYGNVRGTQYTAQAQAAAWLGAAGGGAYTHYMHGPPPGFTGMGYSAHASAPPGSGWNQAFSSVNIGSGNVSAVSISNCGNDNSVITYSQELPAPSKRRNGRKH